MPVQATVKSRPCGAQGSGPEATVSQWPWWPGARDGWAWPGRRPAASSPEGAGRPWSHPFARMQGAMMMVPAARPRAVPERGPGSGPGVAQAAKMPSRSSTVASPLPTLPGQRQAASSRGAAERPCWDPCGLAPTGATKAVPRRYVALGSAPASGPDVAQAAKIPSRSSTVASPLPTLPGQWQAASIRQAAGRPCSDRRRQPQAPASRLPAARPSAQSPPRLARAASIRRAAGRLCSGRLAALVPQRRPAKAQQAARPAMAEERSPRSWPGARVAAKVPPLPSEPCRPLQVWG